MSGNNSSSRISQIEDVRAPGGNGGTTYSFNYNFSSWPPRLSSLTNSVSAPESYTYPRSFTAPARLQAPFSAKPQLRKHDVHVGDDASRRLALPVRQ